MATSNGTFAIVTGASSGIGYHLAHQCAENGFDLLIASDQPEIERAATQLRELGVQVDAVQADLATSEGVEALLAAAKGRQVDALLANAGHGLGLAIARRAAERHGGSLILDNHPDGGFIASVDLPLEPGVVIQP